MGTTFLVWGALCGVLALPGWGQTKLTPNDETAKDRRFARYVKQLKEVVAKRDVEGLRKLSAKDVSVAERPERKGWAAFVEKWHPEEKASPVWAALEDMLDLGFVREHPSIFLSPYVVWKFPAGPDPKAHWVVAWGDEALREGPNARAAEIKRLKFEIVKRRGEEGRWKKVETSEGLVGWMAAAALKDPTMPRAQFSLAGGKWLMVMLED